MEHNIFEKPVRVLVGLGTPRDIETVFQAYAFLSESPRDRHNPDHIVARNVCLAAMNRSVDAQTARSAFAAYAQRVGILVPDMDEVVAAQATHGSAHQPAA